MIIIMYLSGIGTTPLLTIKASHDGPYYAGTSLNLTCDVNPAVDTRFNVDRMQWTVGDDIFDHQSRLERRNVTSERFEYFPLDVVDSATVRCVAQLFTRTYGSLLQSSEDFDLRVEGNLEGYF